MKLADGSRCSPLAFNLKQDSPMKKTAREEKPILFSGLMVESILDNLKTQTRRVIKIQPDIIEQGEPFWTSSFDGDLLSKKMLICPYGKTGGRLWVRETWRTVKSVDRTRPIEIPFAYSMIEGHQLCPPVEYLADETDVYDGKTRASIHMPRWASRINLGITGIRVQRIQDISIEDCRAEGSPEVSGKPIYHHYGEEAHRIWFQYLWDSINEQRGFGWEANPWVWVIDFKKS